jgi:preprotein translocase subunit SecB
MTNVINEGQPPTPESIAAVNAFVKSAEIRRITLLDAVVHAEHVGDNTPVIASLDAQAGANVVGQDFYLRLDFAVDAVLDAESREPAYNIKLSYGIQYEVKDVPPMDQDTVGLLAASHAMAVVHPYIREMVQSLTARMGYPGLLLPLYHLPVTADVQANSPVDA